MKTPNKLYSVAFVALLVWFFSPFQYEVLTEEDPGIIGFEGDDANVNLNTTDPDNLFNFTDLWTVPITPYVMPVDTPPNPNSGPGDPTAPDRELSTPWELPNPDNVEVTFEMDEAGEGYYIHEQVGGIDIRPPSYITLDEYLEWRQQHSIRDYFKDNMVGSEAAEKQGLIPSIDVNSPAFKDIFGGGSVEIRPNGSALLKFALEVNRMENPNFPVRQQRTTNFLFDQQIQLNVTGKIGEKLRLNANWDTEATFDFENQFKVEYNGFEDEIIKKIEAGNVSLPLKGSLIQGGQNLFGVKVATQWGPLTVTTIASQQKGKQESINIKGGALETPFEKRANEYDENRHFFLSHTFRNNYENALSRLPAINSGLQITRLEVWITNNNSSSTQDNRNGLGLIDLGENDATGTGVLFNDQSVNIEPNSSALPDNNSNDLFKYLKSSPIFREKTTVVNELTSLIPGRIYTNGYDFEMVENMRKLTQNEYNLNQQLGYISLNTTLQQNQALFVAYEYQLNGETHQVGEFSVDRAPNEFNTDVLFLKMLKPAAVRPRDLNGDPYPGWDLMMKNIYNIGGYGLQPNNFEFDIFYQSGTDAGDINYMPAQTGNRNNVPLLQVFKLDQLTNNGTNQPDQEFDFIDRITVIPNKGQIIFPVLEPFGSHLARTLNSPNDSAEFVFSQLYRNTRMDAIQDAQQLDRFIFKGSYQGSSSSDISLNAINVAPGSVVVTANGTPLAEGRDYTVDYNLGKVKIINQGIMTSGQDIQVNFETNTLFAIQSKTLVGSRLDYVVNKDIQLGGTILNLNERPLTQKITIGDEPINNTIWGVDAVVRKESKFLTKVLDKLPLINSKEPSQFTGQGEFAQLIPGLPRVIRNSDERGIAYLDDFENTKTFLDLMGFRTWQICAFPGDNGNNDLYEPQADPAGSLGTTGLEPGFSRARIAWYTVDNDFYFQNSDEEFDKEADLNNHYTRQVKPTEVFPNLTQPPGLNLLNTFDIHYMPQKRGPYNYEYRDNKLNPDGTFTFPEDNWAGIMKRTGGQTDFEANNFEYIEFWMMDPFITGDRGLDSVSEGTLFLNLGQVSEDILPDFRRSFENGMPINDADVEIVDSTTWGRVPLSNPPTNSFNNDADSRQFQDIGLDGLYDELERDRRLDIINELTATGAINQDALNVFSNDPSSDNYVFSRGEFQNGNGILKRYEKINGHEGNSPVDGGSQSGGFTTVGSTTPDTEDINQNGTLNTLENYWEYKINLKPSEMQLGRNYIVDIVPAEVELNDNTRDSVKWYQFRVPIRSGTPINIENFKSIDYVRMYMTDFQTPAVLRFAKFQVVSTSWRTFKNSLGSEGEVVIVDPDNDLTTFEIGTVNIEENGAKVPFNYQLPPLIQRVVNPANPQQQQLLNEESLLLKACNLQDKDGRGAFKLNPVDLRSFSRLKMWVHAEPVADQFGNFASSNFNNRGDVSAFLRMGSDVSQNFYEYEIPLDPGDPQDSSIINRDSTLLWNNEFDFALDLLNLAKSARNEAGIGLDVWYTVSVDSLVAPALRGQQYAGHLIHVKGTPKMSEIKSMMVGIRNPDDGGGPVCAEVWFNELRATDFRQNSGYAANARINFQWGDFANITASGSIKTPGFGSIEEKINDRSRELTRQYDLAGTFAMGKFFPAKWGIDLPVYATYGERFVDPQYNPLETDVLTEDYVQLFQEGAPRDSVLENIQTYQRNRGISVTNFRKQMTDKEKKNRFWRISNWTASFAWNQQEFRNHLTEAKINTTHRASLGYNYSFKPKLVKLFKNPKHHNPLTEFNFYLGPKSISFTTQGNRVAEVNQIRRLRGGPEIDPTYYRNFTISRNFNLRWDLSKGLSYNFSSSMNARVDEPLRFIPDSLRGDSLLGNLWHYGDAIYTPDSLRDSLGLFLPGKDKRLNIGRNMGYNHTMAINYVLPFDKYPWTNWINGTVSYQTNMDWRVAPDNNLTLGNTLGNTQTINGTAQVNLGGLYRKVPFLNRIMNDGPGKGKQKPKPKDPTKKLEESLKSETSKRDTTEKEDAFYFLKVIGKEVVKVILSVQNVSGTYTRNMGTTIPGYVPSVDMFGMDFNYEFDSAQVSPITPPTVPFIFGWQYPLNTSENVSYEQTLRGKLEDWADQGWMSRDSTLANRVTQNFNEAISARTSVTLFKDLKIDLNLSRNKTRNYSEIFRFDGSDYRHENQLETGSFNMSSIFLPSAFETSNRSNNWASDAFNRFENDRVAISERLANETADQNGNRIVDLPNSNEFTRDVEVGGQIYRNGFNRDHQDVLIPAFLTAYGYSNTNSVKTNPFGLVPLPNWNVTYNGLSKIPMFKDIFKSVTLKHTYRGTFSINNYTSNIQSLGYDTLNSGNVLDALQSTGQTADNGDTLYNFRPQNIIETFSITEAFAPFIGVNMSMKNGLTITFDYLRSRNISFNTGTLQMTETKNQDVKLAVSWRKDKLGARIRLFGRDIDLKNSLNVRFETTLRDQSTLNRYMDQTRPPEFTNGNFSLIIKPTVDYVVNQKLNIQFFFERNQNIPKISTSFPSAYTAGGVQVRFTLTN